MSVKNLFDPVAFGKAIDEGPFTLKEIAAKVPCRENDLYRYRKGETVPRMGRLKRLVEIMGPSITGLSVSSNRIPLYQFTATEKEHLNWFLGLSVYQQARMLGAFAAVFEFGNDVDAQFAADLAGQLIAEEQRQKEQPG